MPTQADDLLLLDSSVAPSDLPQELLQRVQSLEGKFCRYTLRLSYKHFSYKQVLERLLPTKVPTGYEIVGHIAHFNLQEDHWPHRSLIGQVFLEKSNGIKTVVAKLGTVSSEFRTFDMEVIAGEEDFMVSLREHQLKLRFDFRKAQNSISERHRNAQSRAFWCFLYKTLETC